MLEFRALLELEPHPDRHRQKPGGEKKWHAPAPFDEGLLADEAAGDEHHPQRADKAGGGRRLDPGGRTTAPVRL
jgi:hypothetical protein